PSFTIHRKRLTALVGFPAYRSETVSFFRNLPVAALKTDMKTDMKPTLKMDAPIDYSNLIRCRENLLD
ncbi:MAG: hypothetical protein LBG58_00305, partial [Planctomycetaceae bacterium]|nr:hypothetical protein [Planctomycetaceae bacterium]